MHLWNQCPWWHPWLPSGNSHQKRNRGCWIQAEGWSELMSQEIEICFGKHGIVQWEMSGVVSKSFKDVHELGWWKLNPPTWDLGWQPALEVNLNAILHSWDDWFMSTHPSGPSGRIPKFVEGKRRTGTPRNANVYGMKDYIVGSAVNLVNHRIWAKKTTYGGLFHHGYIIHKGNFNCTWKRMVSSSVFL